MLEHAREADLERFRVIAAALATTRDEEAGEHRQHRQKIN
jgi:hypothetical protein